ncbi:hypothetical protein [Clostridium beijerinckii]|uniref:hypothetical protein n=1 Tax=Clostridium beijerinckii TaxID=1520 RepID=UPI00242FA67F|nr:hypothetical protein [Clostridium beijerinckii]MDG5852475.1 hypothetical protein [Clostridium beijerinckii]
MWGKIDMYDNLRNILIIFTSIVTVSSIIIKTSNSFFIESIKSNYKKQLGNKSLIEVMIELLFYIILVVDILGIILFFIIPIGQSIQNRNLEPLKNFYFGSINTELVYSNILAYIIVTIFFVLLILQIIIPFKYFYKLKVEYKNKLENKQILDLKKIKRIRLTVSVVSLVPTIFLLISSVSLYNMISDISIGQLLFIGLFWINSLAVLILLINLRGICFELKERSTYIFVFKVAEKEADIECNMYLEYDDYYLIFKDEKEVYIKKSEVKKIFKERDTSEFKDEVSTITNAKKKLNIYL